MRSDVESLQLIVDEFTCQLGLTVQVTVTLVPANAVLASVEAAKNRDEGFVLSFDERFFTQLDDDELRAVIAHELGHVWIFTHHPYLQTERGANDIAMRVVSRSSLQRVYDKVWAHDGSKGDLVRFLGSR